MNFIKAKHNMIERQIRPWNVLDERVLAALNDLPREDFVAQGQENLAYADIELPIGVAELVMLPPKIQAKLIQDLGVQPGEKVLELGAQTGYTSAVLAHMGAHVRAYVSHPELIEKAQTNLTRLFEQGLISCKPDFILGEAPKENSLSERFDAILLNGSVAEIPVWLTNLLKPSGRLIAIVGEEPIMSATLLTTHTNGQIELKTLWETVAPRLPGFSHTQRFSF